MRQLIIFISLMLSLQASVAQVYDELIKISNIGDQLPLLHQQLLSSLQHQISEREKAKVPLTQQQVKTIKLAYDTSFDPKILEPQLLLKMSRSLTPGEATEIVRFLKSSLGTKVTLADKQLNTPEFASMMMSQGEQLSKRLPNDINRYAMIKDIEKYSDAASNSADTMLIVQFLMAQNDWYYSPPSPRKPPLAELLKMVGQQKTFMLPNIKQTTLVMLSQVYKNLTDTELEAYIVFLKSNAGQAYYGKMGQALKAVMFEAAQRTGEMLKKAQ
jgi:hypothetical protein